MKIYKAWQKNVFLSKCTFIPIDNCTNAEQNKSVFNCLDFGKKGASRLSITTPSKTTFSIITFRIMGLFSILSINEA
jgi:hypothetical protein